MAVSRALRRLLSVLELEEEQAHATLQRSLGEQHRFEEAHLAVLERERAGRRLLVASAGSGEIVDRLAGMEESRTARRLAGILKTRIAEAAQEVAARREAFLAKRVERQQAATLIEEAQAKEAAEASRRSQQSTDEWFLSRRLRARMAADPAQPSTVACDTCHRDPREQKAGAKKS
jgi:hypothetical protein